jgi:hypothetical protein
LRQNVDAVIMQTSELVKKEREKEQRLIKKKNGTKPLEEVKDWARGKLPEKMLEEKDVVLSDD